MQLNKEWFKSFTPICASLNPQLIKTLKHLIHISAATPHIKEGFKGIPTVSISLPFSNRCCNGYLCGWSAPVLSHNPQACTQAHTHFAHAHTGAIRGCHRATVWSLMCQMLPSAPGRKERPVDNWEKRFKGQRGPVRDSPACKHTELQELAPAENSHLN